MEELSLKPVADWFEDKFPGAGIKVEDNLRFDPGEEADSPLLPKILCDVYFLMFISLMLLPPTVHTPVVLVPKLVSRGCDWFLGLQPKYPICQKSW